MSFHLQQRQLFFQLSFQQKKKLNERNLLRESLQQQQRPQLLKKQQSQLCPSTASISNVIDLVDCFEDNAVQNPENKSNDTNDISNSNTLKCTNETLVRVYEKQDDQKMSIQRGDHQKEVIPSSSSSQKTIAKTIAGCTTTSIASQSSRITNSGKSPYHDIVWNRQFQNLIKFRKVHGHCNVPYTDNTGLAGWVNEQRKAYKLKQKGMLQKSAWTNQRQAALEEIGFVWDAHAAKWEERYNELKVFTKLYGPHGASQRCKKSPKLSIWVDSQKRQLRAFLRGKQSTLTKERWMKLNDIGFIWNQKQSQFTDDESVKAKLEAQLQKKMEVKKVRRTSDYKKFNDKWNQFFKELILFRNDHGHCNVPAGWEKNIPLANWVKYQRRAYRLKQQGMGLSTWTDVRQAALEEIGLVWEPKNGKENM